MMNFSRELKAKIDHWIAKYPPDQKQSAVLPALTLVQAENGGWLTDALMQETADYLGMSYIAVYEVATFYSLYDLKPTGKYKLGVCTNISCMLSDCDKIMDHLSKKLQIKPGETTQDGRFTLKEVECLGACAEAPVMHVGNHYYENLTPEKVDEIIESLK
jgi:NADH-quinone oxidoreductase subunit E